VTLHDFLSGAFDVLLLIDSIELRQEEIEALTRKLEGVQAGDAMRSMILKRLRDQLAAADDEITSAVDILDKF
jgi:hypothetical protein